MHISSGTQRNVVRQGCTSCIKINFLDGQVLFLGIHSTFDLLKSTKFCHGFENISNEIREMQKFGSFLLWNGTTLCSLHFVLQGYVINQCWFSCVFRKIYLWCTCWQYLVTIANDIRERETYWSNFKKFDQRSCGRACCHGIAAVWKL